MKELSKYAAIAMITDPTAVKTRAAASGWNSVPEGLIFCSIPEIGMEGVNLVPCRYALSIPYIRIQEGWKLWVEPTIGETDRWIYTGIRDCGGDITPDSNMQLLIQLLTQVIYATTAGTMHLSSKTATEAYVLGTTALPEFLKHQYLITALHTALTAWTPSNPIETDAAALKVALATFLALPLPEYKSILSTKIFGE